MIKLAAQDVRVHQEDDPRRAVGTVIIASSWVWVSDVSQIFLSP